MKLPALTFFFFSSFSSAQIVPPTFFRGPAPFCPPGYVQVPGNASYIATDFCVGKYEASNTSTFATSLPIAPWSSVTKTNASAACARNGSHYSLITINHWQTIARNIESVASNWSGGAVGSGDLNEGHSDNSPASAQTPDSSDSNGCAGTGQTCTTNWSSQKRTHTLSNGEVIWDFSGNLEEWMADTSYITPTTGGGGGGSYPATTTNSTFRNTYGGPTQYAGRAGMGYWYWGPYGAPSPGDSMARGGWYGRDANAPFNPSVTETTGIYAIDVLQDATYSSARRGFRCVFTP